MYKKIPYTIYSNIKEPIVKGDYDRTMSEERVVSQKENNVYYYFLFFSYS